MTLTEKIIARASGLAFVQPGDEVWALADRIVMNDTGGPRRIASLVEELGGLQDRDRIVLASDHFVPAANLRHAEILKVTREWARAQGLSYFYEHAGILHNLLLQEGLALPGMLVVGSDSHTVTAGAIGALALSVGSTELATVAATGELWLRVPQSAHLILDGTLPALVDMRDVTMHILGQLKTDFALDRAVEFGGAFVEALDLEQRLVLSNQGIEMGAMNAIVPPSRKLFDALADARVEAHAALYPDALATYDDEYRYDVGQLTPQVAAPHMVDNIVAAAAVENVALDAAWIGSCVGGRYADLRAVADVVAGQHLRIPLTVTPATQAIYSRCMQDGTLQTLVAAGAVVHPAGCGPCAGLHSGVLAGGETMITTATRNFKGRMGSRESHIYLASPYTVAASALAGRVIDPREVVRERQAS